MEPLLNAEVIKAAAASTLGILSLMCLIVGVIALAFFKEASTKVKLVVFVLILGGVAGFAYAVVRPSNPARPADPAIPTVPEAPSAPSAAVEATRAFVVGRWVVEQSGGGNQVRSSADYLEDGTFSGTQQAFQGAAGARVAVGGEWDFQKLGPDRFRLDLTFQDGRRWQGTFKILDPDHIHNVDENYVAVRAAL